MARLASCARLRSPGKAAHDGRARSCCGRDSLGRPGLVKGRRVHDRRAGRRRQAGSYGTVSSVGPGSAERDRVAADIVGGVVDALAGLASSECRDAIHPKERHKLPVAAVRGWRLNGMHTNGDAGAALSARSTIGGSSSDVSGQGRLFTRLGVEPWSERRLGGPAGPCRRWRPDGENAQSASR